MKLLKRLCLFLAALAIGSPALATNNLTMSSPTYGTPAKFSNALTGGSGSKIVTTADMPASGALTIECEFYSTGGSVNICAAQSKSDNTAIYWWLGAYSGNAHLEITDSGGTQHDLATSTAITNSAWHHLALVDNGSGTTTLYVDGVSGGTLSYSLQRLTGSTAPFYVRTGCNGGSCFSFSGSVDEVAVFNYAKYTGTFTPPSSAYTGSESGLLSLYHLDSSGADSASNVASAYTLTGPSSGYVGIASSNFTVTPNGPPSGTVTVTPSDSSGGGSFSPSTVSFASGDPSAKTFTYTPGSAGAKTISTTNNGSLTDPSSLTYTATAANIVAPSSSAFHFSPANWSCLGSRGCVTGHSKPTTWTVGAYLSVTWTASSSPTATLLLASNTNGCTIAYSLNGTMTTGVAGTGNITISGTTASASNTLTVYVSACGTSARWGAGASGNVLEVQGLQLDASSTAGTASAPSKWALIDWDSIGEGLVADGGSANFLSGTLFSVMQALFSAGYDVSAQPVNAEGFNYVGVGSIPALYAVSSGTYSEATSRWDKVDAGISMLDSNSHLSAYGATDTEPALIVNFLGTNDTYRAVSTSDLALSVSGSWSAYHTAAPSAKLVYIDPWPVDAGTVTGSASYLSILRSNAPGYVTFGSIGTTLAQMIYSNSAWHYDTLHPLVAGYGAASASVEAIIDKALAPAGGSTALPFRNGFRR